MSGLKSGPAHSDAKSFPVRPNPVATSSQTRSTPRLRHASPTSARSDGSATRMPEAPCTRGSMTTAASDAAWARMQLTILAAQSAVA